MNNLHRFLAKTKNRAAGWHSKDILKALALLVSGVAFLCLNSFYHKGYFVFSFFALAVLCLFLLSHRSSAAHFKLSLQPACVVSGVVSLLILYASARHFVRYWSGTSRIVGLALQFGISERALLWIIAAIGMAIGFWLLTWLLLSAIQTLKKRLPDGLRALRVSSVLLYAVFLVLMLFTIANKENYHVDEMYSYGLANHQGGILIPFEDGKTYRPAAEPYLEYLTVDDGSAFDYGNVWDNQANDVHPPLYYALLHAICSLFPGTFSKWYAGGINIVFALLTLYALRRLIRDLTGNDEKIRGIVSIAFVFSSGILSAASFFRMYMLAMFLVTLLVALFAKELGRKRTEWPFFAKLYCIALLGALTHYYCIVFTVLLCCVYCVFMLLQKRWKVVAAFLATGASAGVTAYTFFPSMIEHMFFGYRGTEALDNLQQSPHEFWERTKQFWNIVDTEAFGNLLGYMIVGLVLVAAFHCLYENVRTFKGIRGWFLDILAPDRATARTIEMRYLLIFIPTAVYFLAVTKMAAYLSGRYMFPVYAIGIGGLLCYMILFIQHILKDKKAASAAMALLLSLMLVNEWKNVGWPYLYQSSAALLEASGEYADVDCLYLYDEKWKTQSSFMEVRQYQSVTFVHAGNMKSLPSLDIAGAEKLVVLMMTDQGNTPETILEMYPQLTGYEEVGSYEYTTTYYFYAG